MIGLRVSRPRPSVRIARSGRKRCPAVRRSVLVRAAEPDPASQQADDEFVVVEDAEEEDEYAETAALPDLDAPTDREDIPLPTYELNVLYLEKAIGIAVDQRLASGETGPVTEYFWWPAKDAWDEVRQQLEAMPWIGQTEAVALLNVATLVINFWQNEAGRPTIEEARDQFPDVSFYGS